MGVVRAVWRGLALSVNWRPVEGQILEVWLETEDALEVCVCVCSLFCFDFDFCVLLVFGLEFIELWWQFFPLPYCGCLTWGLFPWPFYLRHAFRLESCFFLKCFIFGST